MIVVLGGEHLGASRGVIGDDAIQARTDEPVRVTRPHHVLLAGIKKREGVGRRAKI